MSAGNSNKNFFFKRSLLLDMINDWNYSGWSIRTNHASKLEQCFLPVSNQFLPLSTFCIRGQMVDLSHLHSAIKSKKSAK